jgi:GNAT superfamily N-acetyltransferase
MSVVALTTADAPVVAQIHVACLPSDFLSALGKRFLATAFYGELLDPGTGFGYGWREGERLVGYVSATYDAGGFSVRAIRRHPLALLRSLAAAVAARPATVMDALRVARHVAAPSTRIVGPQVRANGVLPGYRGRGIGRRLYEETLRHLRVRGVPACAVMVSADDATVNGLWAGLGGRVERSFVLNGERRNVYRVALSEVPGCSRTSAR